MNEELRRRAERRRLAFSNICNGVRPEQVKRDLQLSDLELKQETDFVLRKINDWGWRRVTTGVPGGHRPFVCDDYREMHNQGRALMKVLDQIPDNLLASDLFLPPIQTQNVDPLILSEVAEKMRYAHTPAGHV
jgi:hypothetical protein